MNICALCLCPLTNENQSKEHIIQAALGGRRTVSSFICRTCNSRTGSTWDAALAKDLRGLARLLDISRARGPIPTRTFDTAEGIPIRVFPGNRVQLSHPVVKEISHENQKKILVVAKSADELRKIAQSISKRTPLTEDIETLVAGRSRTRGFLREAVGYNIRNPEEDGKKSLVKSVLALLSDAGINPAHADNAIKYLTKDNAPKCILPYYKENLVNPRIPGIPLNCVFVKGNPDTHKLMGYIEILGLLRQVVRLSDTYKGKPFEHHYSMNPIDSSELALEIRLDQTIIREAEEQPDHEQEKRVLTESIAHIIRDLKDRNMKRRIESAEKEWRDENNKEPEDILTTEESNLLSDHIEKYITPYILNQMRPVHIPENILKTSSQTENTSWIMVYI